MTRALIVDDERLARSELRGLLAAHSQIEIVGEADAVAPALAAIDALQPEVVFLDVQLRGETGFDLLAQVASPLRVVFVTAYDQHAVRAFEVNALDYLVKPVHPERLARALERLVAPPAEPGKLGAEDRVFLEDRRGGRFVDVAAIRAIRAAGDYSEVATHDHVALSPRALRDWEARLPTNFVRVHRQALVNLAHVARVEDAQVYLHGLAAPIAISRRHAALLKAQLRAQFG